MVDGIRLGVKTGAMIFEHEAHESPRGLVERQLGNDCVEYFGNAQMKCRLAFVAEKLDEIANPCAPVIERILLVAPATIAVHSRFDRVQPPTHRGRSLIPRLKTQAKALAGITLMLTKLVFRRQFPQKQSFHFFVNERGLLRVNDPLETIEFVAW